MEFVHSEEAPRAIGPYSQAVKANGMIYVSGQLGLDHKSMDLVCRTADLQAVCALENLKAILEEAGSGLSKVVKTTVLLTNMEDFKTVNRVYERAFGTHRPARVCYAVQALPMGAVVEIEAIALS